MESVRRERGLKKIIKLASNENPLGPSAKALAAMRKVGKKLFLYPDGASVSLARRPREKAGVTADRVIIGAGSDELIELLGKTFLNPGDSIVVSDHAFIRYRMAAELMGADVITVAMRHYTHDLSAMASAIRDNTKLVFIANPNNPTGTYNTRSELSGFLKQIGQLNERREAPVLVVVDEAYYEYAKALAAGLSRDAWSCRKNFQPDDACARFLRRMRWPGFVWGMGLPIPTLFRPSIACGRRLTSARWGRPAPKPVWAMPHIRRAIQLVVSERKEVLPALAKLGIPVVPSVGQLYPDRFVSAQRRRGVRIFNEPWYHCAFHGRIRVSQPHPSNVWVAP